MSNITFGQVPITVMARAILNTVIDPSASGDQLLGVLTARSFIERIIYILEGSTSLVTGVVKIGNNASANNIVSSQALTQLTATNLGLSGVPNSGFNCGGSGISINANMTTPVVGSSGLRIIIIGVSG